MSCFSMPVQVCSELSQELPNPNLEMKVPSSWYQVVRWKEQLLVIKHPNEVTVIGVIESKGL